MADPEVVVDTQTPQEDDTEMQNVPDITVDESMAGGSGEGDEAGLEDIEPTITERVGFVDYLRSPIVELVIGQGDAQTTLSAHQGLLVQAPYFQDEVERFVPGAPRRIELPNDDIDACAAVLEYIYKGDYFPTVSGNTMEYDPSVPSPDDSGVALLRHARVYTIAKRFGLPALAGVAHKKIHLTQSTAKGEIAYARFVYKETSTEDEAIRKPVAAFWATRSHVLRHEAEQEFKRLCLEHPQFGFDVLSLVLDMQEKRSQRAEASSQSGTRKRQRGL
ncbi:hypothetical protein Q7P36_002726 [Cladosporium allicinum]